MLTEFFPGIDPIRYVGPGSDNHLSFKYYDEDYIVAGKTMKEHFRFAMAYWHSLCNVGDDPFGKGTRRFPGMSREILCAVQRSAGGSFRVYDEDGHPVLLLSTTVIWLLRVPV